MDRCTDVVTVQAESSQLVDGIRVFVQCINKAVSSGLDTGGQKPRVSGNVRNFWLTLSTPWVPMSLYLSRTSRVRTLSCCLSSSAERQAMATLGFTRIQLFSQLPSCLPRKKF